MLDIDTDLLARIRKIEEVSVSTILEGQADSGAFIASPNFRVYAYSWLRDGSFIAEALDCFGKSERAGAFHLWTRAAIMRRESHVRTLIRRGHAGESVPPEEHLPCRFKIDGSDGEEEWTDFQLDGYGTWLWALDRHLERNQLSREPWLPVVSLLIEYLACFWSQPSYDWWEESFGHVHVSSIGCIEVGLQRVSNWPELSGEHRSMATNCIHAIADAIAESGIADGHLSKWLGSSAVDGSLLALIQPLGLFGAGDPVAYATLDEVERQLTQGGVHRHVDDVYFGGGEWILLSAMMGLAASELGDDGTAMRMLSWIVEQANSDGELPEQSSRHLLHPEHYQPWVEKWGEPALPLLWSHAMFLLLIDRLELRTTS